MQAEGWKKIEELYHAALAQPPEQRAAFLTEACSDDALVRDEVMSLLAEQADSFFDQSPVPAVLSLKPGDKLGSFEIVGLLGRGGMGEVYKARDMRLRREVAIKTLPPGVGRDRVRVLRFEREARAASALNHPNIVSVYDVGIDGQVSYIVSELVEGETLARTLQKGALPLGKLIEIGTQVADGLAAAHKAGVVHRDLKPGNIMLTRDGRVKILDFGLARQNRGGVSGGATTEASNPGLILGTPGYMSPEQVRGEPTDARSDLFSFGLILYEMGVGKPAFSGASAVEVMNSILKDEPPVLPAARPLALERIVRRCLEKQTERRFQSASDLGFALAYLTSVQVALPPPSSTSRWKRASAVAALCCLAAGIAYWGWQRSVTPSDSRESTLRRVTSDAGLSTGAAITPDGKMVAYASDRADTNNLDIWVQQADGQGAIRITDDPADDYDPSFSPDGARLAFRSDREGGGVYVVSALGGPAQLLIPQGLRPRFSPDGQKILYSVRTGAFTHALFVRGAPGETPVPIGAGCDVQLGSGVWSPDGSRILFNADCDSSGKNTLWVSSQNDKRTLGPRLPSAAIHVDQWLTDPSRLLCHVDYQNADGASIATIPISTEGTVINGQTQNLTLSTEKVGPASAGGDGRIVFSSESSETHISGLFIDGKAHAMGAPARLTSQPSREYESWPVLSRDGTGLAFLVRGKGGQNLYYKSLARGEERQVSSEIVAQVGAAFSPDARTILFQGSTRGPKDMRFGGYEVLVSGGALKAIWGGQPNTQVVWDWSPDGSTVLFLNGDSPKMTEMDLPSLSKTELLDDPDYQVYQGHFSHDGRWVTFNAIHEGRSRIYVVPFRKSPVPRIEWIAISDGHSDDKPRFSRDDKLMVFTSDRDAFLCIWAQRLGPDMHPSGEPFAVYHSHQRRRSLANLEQEFHMDVGPNLIVFNQKELGGDIWMLQPR